MQNVQVKQFFFVNLCLLVARSARNETIKSTEETIIASGGLKERNDLFS